MPDPAHVAEDPGDPEDRSEYDVDVKALSPWPRLRGRPRQITYRQVLTRSFVVIVAAYLILGYWSVYTPGRQMDVSEEHFAPFLLVLTEVVAPFAAALTALALSTVWWVCWASWNPHRQPPRSRPNTRRRAA